MMPIVTPADMARIDRAAAEPIEVLIERAGRAVARAARRMMGGTYGRRVLVVVGPGNNGADGRVAAHHLEAGGSQCPILEWGSRRRDLRRTPIDLIIDAGLGTGVDLARRATVSPREMLLGSLDDGAAPPVLAVDVPSGLGGLDGASVAGTVAATRTVTFGALKPGLLIGDGPRLAGQIEVADLGLDTTGARAHLVESRDLAQWVPHRAPDAHKWVDACWVIGGSAGMTGARDLAAAAAARAGASHVRIATPGAVAHSVIPEAVSVELPGDGWSGTVLDGADRCSALVLGPGLGRSVGASPDAARVVDEIDCPIVVDADALALFEPALVGERLRSGHTVLTPHEGEARRLLGRPLRPDRFAEATELARCTSSVVLLKGPTTIVADPDGNTLVSRAGDARLATAGSGDVLAGIIGALLAQGMDPLRAAASGAELHGRAAMAGPARGLVAGDVITHLPAVLDGLPSPAGGSESRPGPSPSAI